MNRCLWNRRAFLKASVGGLLWLFAGPNSSESLASISNRSGNIGGSTAEGRLSLYNTHTNERLRVCYRDVSGQYDNESLDALDVILRCHYTEKVTKMDIRVIEFLNTVDQKLGGGHEIHIISGYRSPEYNEWLIQQGRGVAKQSLHLLGRAIDIRIPRVGLDILRDTARGLGFGGVGYYPQPGFIHLDSGRVRSW